MHEVLVNRLGGLSLPRKSVVRLTDRPDMTLDVYRERKTTIQQKRLRRRFPVARFTLFKQTTHACHNQTGQSFSGINFTSEHAGANFLVYYIGRTRL